jgi:hypothetical protein
MLARMAKKPVKKKAARKPKLVVIGASIKRGAVSDPYETSVIPADLAKALAAHAAKRITDAAVCKVITTYLAANFIPGNLDDEALFATDEDTWAFELEAYGVVPSKDGRLPKITAVANFKLPPGRALPKTQDALSEWEEDNTPLTDAINFFWKFGDTELLIGEHEGAGAGFADA